MDKSCERTSSASSPTWASPSSSPRWRSSTPHSPGVATDRCHGLRSWISFQHHQDVPGPADWHSPYGPEDEEILVSGDEAVRAGRNRTRQDGTVLRISRSRLEGPPRRLVGAAGDEIEGRQHTVQPLEGIHNRGVVAEPVLQDPYNLVHHIFRKNDLDAPSQSMDQQAPFGTRKQEAREDGVGVNRDPRAVPSRGGLGFPRRGRRAGGGSASRPFGCGQKPRTSDSGPPP